MLGPEAKKKTNNVSSPVSKNGMERGVHKMSGA